MRDGAAARPGRQQRRGRSIHDADEVVDVVLAVAVLPALDVVQPLLVHAAARRAQLEGPQEVGRLRSIPRSSIPGFVGYCGHAAAAQLMTKGTKRNTLCCSKHSFAPSPRTINTDLFTDAGARPLELRMHHYESVCASDASRMQYVNSRQHAATTDCGKAAACLS